MISSNKEKAVTGVYWMGLMSISNIIIKLLIIMILSRLIAPYEFGIVAAIQIVISFAEVFWMMGIGPAIVQKKELSNEDIATGNTLNIIFGISIFIIIYFLSPIIIKFIGIENVNMLRVLSLLFVISSLSGVSEALLQREMNFKPLSLINIISLFIYGFLGSFLAFLDFGAWALIIAQLVQVSVKTILTLVQKPVEFKLKIEKKSVKSLLSFGMGFTISRIFNTLANQGDYLVINKTLGSTALGFYNRSYQVLLVPTIVIGTVMDKVLFPLLSKYQNENEKMSYVYLNITALMSIIAFPITILVLIMGEELIYVLLGSNWSAAVLPLKILIISLFARMAYKICDSLINSIGKVYRRVWTQIFYAFTVIFGAYVGKDWGINGVAVAVTIAITLNYIIMNILVMRLINLKLRDLLRYLIPIFIISILIGLISYWLSTIVAMLHLEILRLVIMTIVIGVLYLFTFKYVIFKLMPGAFNEFARIIVTTLAKKILPKRIQKRILNL